MSDEQQGSTTPSAPTSDLPPLRKSMVLDNQQIQETVLPPLKAGLQLDEQDLSNDPLQQFMSEAEQAVEVLNNKKKRKKKRIWLLFGALVGALSLSELGLAIAQIYTDNNWLGALWLVVLGAAVLGGARLIYHEAWALRRLKNQRETRQRSVDLFSTPAIGEGLSHCQHVAKQLPSEYQALVQTWQAGVDDHYTNNEVIALFEHRVLAAVDQQALTLVGQHASASAVMIAVSPFALLDMLIVLWRNLRMLNQLSELYGVPLGYWGRIALIKQIFRSMLIAGAAEIVSDAGNYALSAGITGKLSTRVAQGLGAGVMTSRIGLKAMAACRPMPWLALPAPGLSTLSNKLLHDLAKYIK
jgi:putative membrane protein